VSKGQLAWHPRRCAASIVRLDEPSSQRNSMTYTPSETGMVGLADSARILRVVFPNYQDLQPCHATLNPRSRVKMTISRKSSRGSQSLPASGSSCYKFPFRFVVKSEMPSMLLQHFDLWGGDHLPLFFFIRHSSMFVEQSWHLRLNREISSDRRSHQYFFCAQYCHGCYLQQPPAVAGRNSCFLFQPAVVHPTEKSICNFPQESCLQV